VSSVQALSSASFSTTMRTETMGDAVSFGKFISTMPGDATSTLPSGRSGGIRYLLAGRPLTLLVGCPSGR
jgi:hypothetical protein